MSHMEVELCCACDRAWIISKEKCPTDTLVLDCVNMYLTGCIHICTHTFLYGERRISDVAVVFVR